MNHITIECHEATSAGDNYLLTCSCIEQMNVGSILSCCSSSDLTLPVMSVFCLFDIELINLACSVNVILIDGTFSPVLSLITNSSHFMQ